LTNITNADIKGDCFYPILDRMNHTFLEKHYGQGFMGAKPTWISDFVRKIKSEKSAFYARESFMMSFYMGTDNLYGLPERSSRYYLNLTGGR
jgi:hypothetical protein